MIAVFRGHLRRHMMGAMRLLDTHLHLLHPDRFAYAWAAGVPALQGAFTLDDYRKAVAAAKSGAKVEAAQFMEVDVERGQQYDEAAFFANLVRAGDPTLRWVIASCRPELPGFAAHAEKLAAIPEVRGLRRILHAAPDALSDTRLFEENLRRLPALGLSFDLCLQAHQLPIAVRLAKACPHTQFILDHCGNPQVAKGERATWLAGMREVAACPNIACKVSGLAIHADANKPLVPQLKPYIEEVAGLFGWERVLWGSDWPVVNLGPGLPAWLDATVELFAGESAARRDQLAAANARRIYRLG